MPAFNSLMIMKILLFFFIVIVSGVSEWVLVVLLKILTVLSFVSLRGFCTWGMITDSWGSFAHYAVSVYLGEYIITTLTSSFCFTITNHIHIYNCSFMIINLIAHFPDSDSSLARIIILVKK